MQQPDWKYIWQIVRKYILNKYVLTLIIFGIIFLFIGEQSLIKGIKRNHQIRKTQSEIQASQKAIEFARQQLNALQQVDSLEKYAREHYLMHKDDEDIFLVEEE